MTVDIGDVLEVAARMEFNGVEDQVNVYQFALGTPGPITDTEAVDDLIALMEAVYTIWKATMVAITAFRDLRVRNVTKDEVLGVFPWPTLTVGDSAADALPPGNAGLINFNTDVARVTPRKYMGSLNVNTVDNDGTLIALQVTKLVEVADLLLDVWVGVDGDWLYGYLSPKAGTFVFPNSATVSDITAYQRRRKQGRGS